MASNEIKKVLVTGGAGYIGSVLVPILLDEGYKVNVLDNLRYGGMSLLPNFARSGFSLTIGDVADPETTRQCVNSADAIVHLAAIVGYPACRKDPELARAVNVGGTKNILEARRKSQSLIFASTVSNYGKGEALCKETTPLAPLSVYGQTKTEAEKLVIEAGNSVVYRFATAFGLSPRLRLDLMINDFCYQAVKNRQLIVYEPGFRRAFIHVRDIARSVLFGLENFEAMKGGIFNIGHESMNFTKEKIARIIRKHVEFYLHFADFAEDEDKRDYELDCGKIRDMGFATTISLEEGIDELLKGMRVVDLPHGYSNI